MIQEPVSPFQVRAIHFLDEGGDIKNIPTREKKLRQAVKEEHKRRLKVAAAFRKEKQEKKK